MSSALEMKKQVPNTRKAKLIDKLRVWRSVSAPDFSYQLLPVFVCYGYSRFLAPAAKRLPPTAQTDFVICGPAVTSPQSNTRDVTAEKPSLLTLDMFSPTPQTWLESVRRVSPSCSLNG